MPLDPLSPTELTTLTRERHRAAHDRAALRDILDNGLLAHLGVVIDGTPRVLPTVYAPDWASEDPYGTVYVHGSVAAVSLRAAPTTTVCLTVTLVDGLVLARSGFAHSMNFRSAMVYGVPRQVTDPDERDRALALLVDHVVPGRAGEIREPTRKELAATTVLALSLHEASVKVRTGDPEDEPQDLGQQVWAGVLPIQTVIGDPATSPDCPPGVPVPPHVRARVG